MRVFGAHYVSSAAPTLQILVLAAIPLTIKSHYVAVYRIAGRISRALPLVWTTAALEIAAAAAGARWFGTLRGFSGAWLVMLAIESTLMIVPVRAATRAADAAELTGRLSS
jgi:hypothetical protein